MKALPNTFISNFFTSKYLNVPISSLVYTPTIHKKRRRALRALFSDKSLQRGIHMSCREAAALTVQCLPRRPPGKVVTEVSGGG